MKSDFELLGAQFDALSTASHTFDAVKLGYPVQGFESMEEVRQAIRVEHSRGYIQYPEENIDAVERQYCRKRRPRHYYRRPGRSVLRRGHRLVHGPDSQGDVPQRRVLLHLLRLCPPLDLCHARLEFGDQLLGRPAVRRAAASAMRGAL